MQFNAELVVGEIHVGGRAHPECDQHFGQEKQELGDFVQCDDTQKVSHQQIERVPGTPTERGPMNGAHYVRVFVQKSQELLQTPEEASATAQHAFGHIVVVFLQFALDEFQQEANDPADRNH